MNDWENKLKLELTDMIFTFPNTETRDRIIERVKLEIQNFANNIKKEIDMYSSYDQFDNLTEYINNLLEQRSIGKV